MRKALLVVFSIMCVFVFSITFCFAAVDEISAIEDAGQKVAPYYVVAKKARAVFSITGDKANCYAQVISKKSGDITSVKGDVKVINGKGNAVKKYNQYLKKGGTTFTFSQSVTLPAKGSYYMVAKLYCYKNRVLKETITKQTAVKVYQ